MKKIYLLAVMFVALAANAQKGGQSAGIQIGYGSEVENIGLGVHYNYNITDKITLAPSFNYFLEKDYRTMWDINLDVHYNFAVADAFTAYPLAGLTYTNWKWDIPFVDEITDSYFGINLGAGIMYDITETILIGAELKYQLLTGDGSDGSQVVFGVKAAYKF